MSDPEEVPADILPVVDGLAPRYRVGDIGVIVAGSAPRWKRRVEQALSRQLGGLESNELQGLRGRLILADYAGLDPGGSGRLRLPMDQRVGVAMLERDGSLYAWCTDWAVLSLTFLLELLLVAQGRTFCHAAALSDAGRGVMIAGRSRAGKTGAAIALMAQSGFRFMSDDFVILDRGGRAFAYPVPLTLYPYHRVLLADSGVNMRTRIVQGSAPWKGARRLFAWVGMDAAFERWFSPGYAVVRLRDLYPDTRIHRGDVRVSSVYTLIPSTSRDRVAARTATVDETVTLLLGGTHQDWSSMLPLLRAYLTAREMTIEDHLRRVREIIGHALHDVDRCVVVEAPVGVPPVELARSVARIVSRE